MLNFPTAQPNINKSRETRTYWNPDLKLTKTSDPLAVKNGPTHYHAVLRNGVTLPITRSSRNNARYGTLNIECWAALSKMNIHGYMELIPDSNDHSSSLISTNSYALREEAQCLLDQQFKCAHSWSSPQGQSTCINAPGMTNSKWGYRPVYSWAAPSLPTLKPDVLVKCCPN